MARSPRTKAEWIADPTVAYNPSIEELRAAMAPAEPQRSVPPTLVNDLNCIKLRANAMIEHFAPMFGVAASDLRHLLKLVEEGHHMSDGELEAYTEGIRRQIAKLDEAKQRLTQRANEIANFADVNNKLLKDSDGSN